MASNRPQTMHKTIKIDNQRLFWYWYKRVILSFMDFVLGVFVQAERSKCFRATKLLYPLPTIEIGLWPY